MKSTVSVYDFRQAFHDCGRDDQFSYEALGLMFDWFEELDPDMELDPIAICCEFCEETEDEICSNYDVELYKNDAERVENFLNEMTLLIGVTDDGRYVYQAF